MAIAKNKLIKNYTNCKGVSFTKHNFILSDHYLDRKR